MSPERSVKDVFGPYNLDMAERVGFEPTVRFPVRSLSRRVLSTTQSPLRALLIQISRAFGDTAMGAAPTRWPVSNAAIQQGAGSAACREKILQQGGAFFG